MNMVCISGNLCADPVMYTTESGIMQATCRVAVEREFKDAVTGRRETDFFQVVAWRNQAQYIGENARKGDKLTVKGVIQTRRYVKDGVERQVTEIHADRVELDRRSAPSAQNGERIADSK